MASLVTYEFMQQDGTLAKVAKRFRVTPQAIWAASQLLPSIKGRAMSSLKFGEFVFIPAPEPADDPWARFDWVERVVMRDMTVAALVQNFQDGDDRAVPITAADWWFNLRNVDLRRKLLHAGQADDPTQATIKAQERVKFPIRKPPGADLNVPPTSQGQPKVVPVPATPAWVTQIKDWCEDVTTLADRVKEHAVMSNRVREECAKDLAILLALSRLADICKHHGGPVHASSMNILHDKTEDAGAKAAVVMLTNPGKIIWKWTNRQKEESDKALHDKVNSPDILPAFAQMKKTPDAGLQREYEEALKYATELGLDGTKANETGQEIFDALKFSPGNPDNLSTPHTALEAIAAIGNVASVAVGNTPSPSNLIIALASMRCVQNAPAFIKDPSLATEMARFLKNTVMKLPTPEGKPLSDAEVAEINQAIQDADIPKLQSWNSKLIRQYSQIGQKSFGASFSVSALGAIALWSTWSTRSQEDIKLRLWANLGGAGIQTGLGAMQASQAGLGTKLVSGWLGKLGETGQVRGALNAALTSEAAEAVGVFGCALGVLSGTISMIEGNEKGDTTEFWLGAGQTAGGALSLVGWFMMVPGLQALGVTIGIGVAIAGAIVLLRDKLREGTERVFSSRLEQFRASPNVKAFEHDSPGFAPVMQALADFARNKAEFSDLENTDDVKKQLGALGFVKDEIDMMLASP